MLSSKTILEEICSRNEFEISPANPGLLYEEDSSGTCIIIIYVDEMLVIGNKEIIEELNTKVEEVFSIKTEDNLTDYLGCGFPLNKNKKGWLGQPSIIKSLEKKLGEEGVKHRLA